MTVKIRELLDERAALVVQARELVDLVETEARDFSAEEDTNYNEIMEKVDGLGRRIDRHQKQEELDKRLAEPPQDPAARDLPAGMDDPKEQERSKIFNLLNQDKYSQAVRQYLRTGDVNVMAAEHVEELRSVYQELRGLQADLDTKGGYWLGMEMANQVIKAVDNQLFARQYGTILQLEGASSGLGAVSLDTDPSDSDWTGEIVEVSEDTSMEFGKRELRPNLCSKLVKLSMILMNRLPSIDSFVSQRLAYKFAVTQEQAYLTGSGAGQPLGVFTASNDGISTGRDVSTGNTTTAIAFDGLINAKYTLKGQYWRNARWCFHRDAVKQIAKLKDGDGQYLWQPAVRLGQPELILGVPFDVSEYAPNTFTTGLYVGMLADWSWYWILDDMMLSIQVLKEKYANTNQVGLIGRYSGDGMPVLEEAFVRVKLA